MVVKLRYIYSHGHRRPGPKPWYKQPTEGASCPEENRQTSVAQSYWNAFGCTKNDNPESTRRKITAAKTCASERIAQMHHLVKQGAELDPEHVYPIKLAYGLGRDCFIQSQGNEKVHDYDLDFIVWYNELTGNGKRSDIDLLFQQINSSSSLTNDNHPLTGFNIKQNTGIRHARALSARTQRAQRGQTTNLDHILSSQTIGSGAGAGAGAAAVAQNANMNMNSNNIKTNNSNNFLSSSFAQQKPKGKKKQGGRRQTHRRRAVHKKATRRR